MQVATKQPYTPAEYLKLEEKAEYKSEYWRSGDQLTSTKVNSRCSTEEQLIAAIKAN